MGTENETIQTAPGAELLERPTRTTLGRWVPFGVVCAFIFLVNAWSIAQSEFGASILADEVAIGIMLGSGFAQIGLAAVWMTLMPYRWPARLSFAIVLVGSGCLMVFQFGYPIRVSLGVSLVVAFLLQSIVCQTPLWLARWKGWTISQQRVADVPRQAGRSETQFGIRQLFIWTTIIAGLMGLARAASGFGSADPSRTGHGYHTDIPICIVLMLAGSLMLFPVIWSSFVRRNRFLWAGLIVVVLFVTTGLEFLVFQAIVPTGRSDAVVFILINVTQVISTGLALLSLRFVGFRLQKLDPTVDAT